MILVGGGAAAAAEEVAVLARRWANPTRFTPDEVALAVEVLSPGSRRTDRVLKLAEYGDAGVEQYWTVETGTESGHEPSTNPVVTTFALPAAGSDETSSGTQRGASANQHLGTYTSTTTLRVAGHQIGIDPTNKAFSLRFGRDTPAPTDASAPDTLLLFPVWTSSTARRGSTVAVAQPDVGGRSAA